MQQTVLAGRYRLVDQLGRGGMGAVWRAHDELLGRDVAVKEVLLPPGVDDDTRDDLLERTKREARAAARLNHPNVVTVFDVVDSGERPWIVMELVKSRGLNQIVREDGPLPPERVASIGVQLLNALGVAHASGIFHRDVKPSNVLVADSGRVVLADFGIASVQGDPAMTRSGLILGSPSYIAPERARGLPAGGASDLWALGATLYTAVEGRPPYDRDGIVPILAAAAMEDPDPYQLAGPLAPVLTALLRRDPANRPAIDEARLALRQVALLGPPTAPVRGKASAKQTAVLPAAKASLAITPIPRTAPEAAGVRPTSGGSAGLSSGAPSSGAPSSGGSGGPAPSAPTSGGPVGGGSAPVKEEEAAFGSEPAPAEGAVTAEPEAEVPKTPRRASIPMQAASPPPTLGKTYNPTRNRTYAAVAGVLAAIILVAIAAVALISNGNDTKTNTSEQLGSATPNTSATSKASPSSPTNRSDAATTAPPASSAIPVGTGTYTGPGGFTIAVPNGWTKVVDGDGSVEIQDHRGLYLLIQQSKQPATDTKAYWEQQEASRIGAYPGYQKISITGVSYRTYSTAADWEFRYSKRGSLLHVVYRYFVTGSGQAYFFYWQTPDSAWAASQPYFANFTNTFKPAS